MSVEEKVQAVHDRFNLTKGLVPEEQIERLRVIWKKGRNMFSAFFAELETVKRQIGNDEKFASWCFFQLGIGMHTLNDMALALRKEDAERVRTELADAKQAEADRIAEERHQRKLAKIRQENELAAERAKNAEVKAAKVQEAQRAKKAEAAAENKRRRAEKAQKEGDAIVRARNAILANPAAGREAICMTADVIALDYERAVGQLESEGLIAPKKRAVDDTALYDQYVIEGRAIVQSIPKGRPYRSLYERAVSACRILARSQWEIGDWAIKVNKEAKYGNGTLEKFAADISVEYSTLRGYVAVAKAYPKVGGPENDGRPSFSVADALRSHPDRAAIVARDPHMTVEEAREIMRAYKTDPKIVNLRD